EARALSFMSRYGAAFGLPVEARLQPVGVAQTDALGLTHVRLQQLHDGVPVTGAELLVHLRGSAVVAANGTALPAVGSLPTPPPLEAARAGGAGGRPLRGLFGADAAPLRPARLQILVPALLGAAGHPGGLAWFVEAQSASVHEYVWISARAERVLLHFSQR